MPPRHPSRPLPRCSICFASRRSALVRHREDCPLPGESFLIASLFSRIRKREIESGAFIDFAFGPYSASMTFNDTLHDGQADAGAFELLSAVKSLQDAEELFRQSRIAFRAVVSAKIHRSPFV